jgi:hypothetical protein
LLKIRQGTDHDYFFSVLDAIQPAITIKMITQYTIFLLAAAMH